MDTAKIVIVGTGPSGIAAATKLLEFGFQKVYLVEAEDRIGGRINTVPLGDNVVDLGAQWCHGEKGNAVYELANPLNLLEPTEDVLKLFEDIRSNSDKVPAKDDESLKKIFGHIRESYEKGLVDYSGSLGAYVTDMFFEELKKPENSHVDMAIAKEFLETYKKVECTTISCGTLEEASGKGNLEYSECEGNQTLIWKDKGFKTFLRLLLNSDEKGTELGVLDGRVMLGKRVKTIVWNVGDQVKLICEDNDEILADHVIVTVSLGVLKDKHATLFDPKLPAENIRAIEGLGFGTVDKMVFEFPTQFWPDGWAGCTLLWREEDLKEIRGTDCAWLEHVFVFNNVKYKPRVLFGWMIGDPARSMEKLSEEEVQSGLLYLLRRFLPWDIPEPTKFVRSTWYSNENFRGSYSFRSMLTDEMNTGAVDLARPLKNAAGVLKVLFAGEATNTHHFSTVHGAVESGRREAERLRDIYRTVKSN